MVDVELERISKLGGREFINEVKSRLSRDSQWAILEDPSLTEYVRWALHTMLESIARQKETVGERATPEWLKSVGSLERMVRGRLSRMPAPAPSNNRETRAWKSFTAEMAAELSKHDPEALERLKIPYAGISTREWLEKRKS